jgi:hypothetical protein
VSGRARPTIALAPRSSSPRQDPHVPFVQNWNGGQTLPQPPQFDVSVSTSTQPPLHAFVPGPQTQAPD